MNDRERLLSDEFKQKCQDALDCESCDFVNVNENNPIYQNYRCVGACRNGKRCKRLSELKNGKIDLEYPFCWQHRDKCSSGWYKPLWFYGEDRFNKTFDTNYKLYKDDYFNPPPMVTPLFTSIYNRYKCLKARSIRKLKDEIRGYVITNLNNVIGPNPDKIKYFYEKIFEFDILIRTIRMAIHARLLHLKGCSDYQKGESHGVTASTYNIEHHLPVINVFRIIMESIVETTKSEINKRFLLIEKNPDRCVIDFSDSRMFMFFPKVREKKTREYFEHFSKFFKEYSENSLGLSQLQRSISAPT